MAIATVAAPPACATRPVMAAWRRARLCLAAGAAGLPLLLSGCGSGGGASAWQLMQQQQQEQAMIQQQQDEAARKQAPTQPQVALSVIRETQSQGRYFASLAFIDAYRQQFGDTPELAVLRADALRMTGQDESSGQAYRALLDTAQAGQGWRGLGLLAGARGDYVRAADDLARASHAYPTDPSILSDLGYARLRAGDFGGARVPLGQAAELDPANAKVLGNLALLLLVQGDASGAERVMEQARLSPEARSRVYQLAQEMQAPAPQPAASMAPPLATAQVAPVGAAAVQAARPAAMWLPAQQPSASTAVASQAPQSPYSAPQFPGPQSPALQSPASQSLVMQPLMDRFGNQPLLR